MVRSRRRPPVADEALLAWLLEGDPAVRWRVLRAAGPDRGTAVRDRSLIATQGWGARLLEAQHEDGGWGDGPYSPKWTSTTYTCSACSGWACRRSIQQLHDGGWNCATRTDKDRHGSLHTTIQALEALDAYARGRGAPARPAADGRWRTYRAYPGRHWFALEPAGPSRWTTVRALRVLSWWDR